MNSLIGKTIGQYRIISEIGRGGMAVVHKAEQPSLNRFVALKVLFPNFTGDASSVERLQREAQTAAGLDHPNIVDIYEVGEQDGLHYIAMKFIDGQPLDKILEEERKALPPDRSLRILAQVASALDYAHRQNLVHRDIKPSNILVGEGDRVNLTDFGLVKAAGSATITSSGTLVGTPIYMSPEQARGLETDYRGDIYSLGVVSYEMLAGRPPFTGNPLSVILAHASQEPPPLRSLRSGIPPWVEAAVLRALDKEPGNRYATAGEFIATLRQALTWRSKDTPPGLAGAQTQSLAAKEIATTEPTRAPIRFVWAIAAVIVLIMASVLIGLVVTNSRGETPAMPAVEPAPTDTAVVVAEVASPTSSPTIEPTETPMEPSPTSPPPTSPPPTAVPTATQVKVIVAVDTQTPRPPATDTETPLPPPTETPLPPPTETPTWTPEPSATDTIAPAPTATLTPSNTPSPTRAAPTAAPPPPLVKLLGPAEGQIFTNTDTPTMTWSRTSPLADDERFVVVIDRMPPAPHTGIWHDYNITREQSLIAPHYLAETTADGRFEWYVQVMRSPRVESGILFGTLIGEPSATRSFAWLVTPPPGGGEPGGPEPTPTRDD